MAKTRQQVKNSQIKKHCDSRTRDCVVKLKRLTKTEIDYYSNPKIVITKSFDIKIRGNNAEVNNIPIHSSNKAYTIELKSHGADLILENSGNQRKILMRKATVPKLTVAIIPKVRQTNKPTVKSLNETINEAWKKCKAEFKLLGESIDRKNFVMAKMSGYSAWPARIDDFTKNGKRAHVFFYGSNNTGSADISEIVPFGQCYDVIRLLLLRKCAQFRRSIIDIELSLNVPDELSLLREMLAIEN